MAKHAIIQTFYASDIWRAFRMMLINERVKKDGRLDQWGLRCEHCEEWITDSTDLILHHMIELTKDNVHDAMIALNPANIQIVHKACHNQIHKRNAAKVGRQAFIVYGPPLSGKTTFVQENMMSGDLIVDIDAIFKSVSMLPAYDKPNDLLPNVRAVHNLLIDNIKTRYGKWNTAWVIGGYADRYKRDKMADELGAELVFMETTREQCLERLKNDYLRSKREAEWTGYINKWFEEYTA